MNSVLGVPYDIRLHAVTCTLTEYHSPYVRTQQQARDTVDSCTDFHHAGPSVSRVAEPLDLQIDRWRY